MTVMRPGLFYQREEPGSEPGNSLGCPDAAACSVCGSLATLLLEKIVPLVIRADSVADDPCLNRGRH